MDRFEKLNAYFILSREGRNGKDYVDWFIRAVCKKYELVIPEDRLEYFNHKEMSGIQKIDLSVKIADFYQMTDSRIKDFIECIGR